MYVTLCVFQGARTLLPWTMHLCTGEHTFALLLEEVRGDNEWPPNGCTCSLTQRADSPHSESVTVPMAFNVRECCAMNGRYIRFFFPPSTTEDGKSRGGEVNAYSVLMESARESKLPSKLLTNYETGRGDLRLHDDIIDFLRERNLGFSPGLENTTGSLIVKCLTDALFYIQPHHKTLQARIPNFLPPYFSDLFSKVYNDPKAHKHAVPQLKSVQLNEVSAPLYSILLLPMMTRSQWKDFSAALAMLAENFKKYSEYLDEKTSTMSQMHASTTPARSISDGKSVNIKIIKAEGARKPNLITRYEKLEEKLSTAEDYEEPLFVNDFAPLNSRMQYVYLHEIALPFNVELYSYHHGNNLGTLWYIWRIPGDPDKYDPAKTKQMTALVEQTIPEYHTREMRKQFSERFGLVINAKPSVLNEMYQFFTNDCSRSTTEYHVSQKLKFMLDSQDPEVVFDLRDVNQGRPQLYEEFWTRVEAFINEKALEAVDSRRHGTMCHLAAAFSVRDLRDQILQKKSRP